MNRRSFLVLSSLGCAATASSVALAGPPRRRVRRTVRRTTRRRVRRRTRRRVRRRVVAGRSLLVIPVATTVGWELEVESQVVVVTSVQPASGDQPETITVQDSGGNTSTMEVVREDNADNGVELEGSEVPEDTSGSATTQSSTDESPPASESSCAVSRSPAAGAVPLATVGLALALRRWAVARPHGLN